MNQLGFEFTDRVQLGLKQELQGYFSNQQQLVVSQTERETITQFDRYIHRMINSGLMGNYISSDVCLDRDDLLEFGRYIVHKAIQMYKPDKGMRLSTWVIKVLKCKFINEARRIETANKKGTVNMATLELQSCPEGSGDQDRVLIHFQSLTREIADTEGSIADYIDAKEYVKSIFGHKRKVFIEFFMNGLNKTEIHEKHPDIGYNRIKFLIENLEKEMQRKEFLR